MRFEWRASTLASEAILPVREVVTWVRAEVRVLFLAFTRATFTWAAFLRICTLRTRRDSVLADTVKVLASKARCDLARLAQVSAISLLLLGEADGDNGFAIDALQTGPNRSEALGLLQAAGGLLIAAGTIVIHGADDSSDNSQKKAGQPSAVAVDVSAAVGVRGGLEGDELADLS
jgi:hypothetical protein